MSLRTGKKYTYNPKNNNNSTILDHLYQAEECNGELNDFEIIGKANNDFCLHIKESSLLIQRYSIATLLIGIVWLCRCVTYFLLSSLINVYFLFISIMYFYRIRPLVIMHNPW